MWVNNDSTMQNEGGFMDTSSSSTPGDKSNLRRGQHCIPVMIMHLNRYGDNLSLWGTSVRMMTFVAIVRKIESLSTKVNFEFQDETGSIRGIKWLEADITDYNSPVAENSYARVYGMIRSQNDDKFVLITAIQPIEHLNELLTHLMEVTLVSLEGEKMFNQVAQNDFQFVSSSANITSTSNIADCPVGLNREQALVYDIVRNGEPEYGAERNEIKSKVPPHMVSRVDEILEFLSGEGHIYTTKTDDHYKII